MIFGNVYTSRSIRSKVKVWPIDNQFRKIPPTIHNQEKGIYLFKSFTITSDNFIYISSRIEAFSQLLQFHDTDGKESRNMQLFACYDQRNLGAFRQQLVDDYIF